MTKTDKTMYALQIIWLAGIAYHSENEGGILSQEYNDAKQAVINSGANKAFRNIDEDVYKVAELFDLEF